MNQTFELTFTAEQLAILDRALQQLPYHLAAPLLNEINRQIAETQGDEE
jgi:hypothetical protein